MIRYALILGLLLGCFGMQAQDLETLLEKALPPSDSSGYYFSQAETFLRTSDDRISFLTARQSYYSEVLQRDSLDRVANELVAIYAEANDYDALSLQYHKMGYYLEKTGLYDEAIALYFKSVEAAKRQNNYVLINRAYRSISQCHRLFHDYDEAIFYAKKTILETPDTYPEYEKDMVDANNLIGAAFSELNKPDSTLFYYERVLSYVPPLDSIDIAATLGNMGYAYLLAGDIEKSRQYNQIGLDMYSKLNNEYALAVLYVNSGMTENVAGEYQRALRYLDSGVVYTERTNYVEMYKWIYDEQYKIYKAQGKFEAAMKSLDKLRVIKDSLFEVERAKAAKELETQYETAEKETQILQQRAQLAEKELEVRQKNIIIFGSLALALVLGILGYMRYKQQKLRNQQLRKENELKYALAKIETQNKLQEQRLRISRDLHDNIGAQLTFIISSLDNLKYGFKDMGASLENRLGGISRFTSATIYELRDTIWAMNKEEITFEDLQARITNFIEKARTATSSVTFECIIEPNVDSDYTFTSVEGMNIYRIIQESVNNALKYAQANQIKVIFSEANKLLTIQISDNGQGFDSDLISDGNGLQNMKKRARDIDAEWSVLSQIDHGTTIEINVPKRS
ncbi:tetratricopeptide repeat-containing sensor histidine kinase [Altibacter sp. HG106]|uniref:tetratricopeptide repeat-containing sensor histidine kinase n=1 Tax=Altibacter sp. HG106 TaxID=3023937 RepID=UPI0023508D73|nr:sensor histidine kinase [Altibacter sp. HG106]MDC7994365.1 sensor histidine kinase [Altibacter sp. HG106]